MNSLYNLFGGSTKKPESQSPSSSDLNTSTSPSTSTTSTSTNNEQQTEQNDQQQYLSPLSTMAMNADLSKLQPNPALQPLPVFPGLDVQTEAKNSNLDYFFIDELPLVPGAKVAHSSGKFGPLPMRTSGDKMLYGTGAAYVMGVSAGGIMGMYRGLRSKAMKELVGSGASWRLKMNSVVNSTTRYGPWLGNSWGMLTFMWTATDSILSSIRGTDDYYNHISSAVFTGLVFKSTAGLRPALLMGGLLGSLVSAYGAYGIVSRGELKPLLEEWKGKVDERLGAAKSNV